MAYDEQHKRPQNESKLIETRQVFKRLTFDDIEVEDVDGMEQRTNNSEHDCGKLDLQSNFSDMIGLSSSPRSLSMRQADVNGLRPRSLMPEGPVLAHRMRVMSKPQAAKQSRRPLFSDLISPSKENVRPNGSVTRATNFMRLRKQ